MQHVLAHPLLAEAHGLDGVGMQRTHDLAIDLLVEDDRAHHLDAAAGRAGTRDKAAEKQDPHLREHRPLRVVVGRQPQRGGNRNHVETDRAQGFQWRSIHAGVTEVEGQQRHADQQGGDVGGNLGISAIDARLAAQDRDVVGGVVHAGQEGEEGHHHLDMQAVVEGQRGIVVGKAAQTRHREGVNHRIPAAHAGQPETDAAGHGEQEIRQPQPLGGFRDARRQARLLHRRRHLGLVDLATADAEQRQDGDHQHDHAHAADPVHEGAPQVDRQRQAIQPRQRRRTGRGEAGSRLEVGMGKVQPRQLDEQGQGAEQRRDHPGQCHQQEAVARQQIALDLARRQLPQRQADADGDGNGNEKAARRAIALPQRDAERHQHEQAEQHLDHAECADDGVIGAHVRETRNRPGRAFRPASPCPWRDRR